MPRYAQWLAKGMQDRGHRIEVWSPKPICYRWKAPRPLKKWLGYVDQYILFPMTVRKNIKQKAKGVLYVFADHALGPWVPLVADKKHVLHCHDFLAQRSALGEIPENPTGWTGRQYQKYIRRGYGKGKNFIAISQNTKAELLSLLDHKPNLAEVVYNGLNQPFRPVLDVSAARVALGKDTGLALEKGYLLHVGGNQWYKNRLGVITIYEAWRCSTTIGLPLLLVGPGPTVALRQLRERSPYKEDIHFMSGMPDVFIRRVYAAASLLLFPSLAEGFGWPIAEAMASGCPVITTDAAPMSEVGAMAAFYIERMPPVRDTQALAQWSAAAAQEIDKVLGLSHEQRVAIINAGIENVERFDPEEALDKIAQVYEHIMQA